MDNTALASTGAPLICEHAQAVQVLLAGSEVVVADAATGTVAAVPFVAVDDVAAATTRCLHLRHCLC